VVSSLHILHPQAYLLTSQTDCTDGYTIYHLRHLVPSHSKHPSLPRPAGQMGSDERKHHTHPQRVPIQVRQDEPQHPSVERRPVLSNQILLRLQGVMTHQIRLAGLDREDPQKSHQGYGWQNEQMEVRVFQGWGVLQRKDIQARVSA
jgi:hypothetical protein